MLSQIANTLGLISNMFGVVLLFVYGFPQPNLEEGVAIGVESLTVLENGKTVAQHDEEVRKIKRTFTFQSSIALVLIILGFLY